MGGPARKREAVRPVRQELEGSERRACATLRHPRSPQRYRGRKRRQDAALAAELRGLSAAHPRAGYRRAAARRRRAGMEINDQRVRRAWRQEGLKVPRRQRKRARLGRGEGGTQRLKAARVNHGWSCDFVQPGTGGAGSRASDGGQRRDPHPGGGGECARERAGVYPQRPRPRARGAGGAGVERAARLQDALHQTRQPLAERLQRELQQRALHPQHHSGRSFSPASQGPSNFVQNDGLPFFLRSARCGLRA